MLLRLLFLAGIATFSASIAGAGRAGDYLLDLSHRSVMKSIDKDIKRPEAVKFVQVEVGKVVNPRKVPLSFRVQYQAPAGEKPVLLGTFSLFPPDNPGTFIVATSGKLQVGGKVVVSLAPLTDIKKEDAIRVELRKISFVQ